MTDEFRDCPDCGLRSEFGQVHPDPEQCPDGADESCPEWFCVGCGAGLLISSHPLSRAARPGSARRRAARPAIRLDRVA